MSHQTVRLTPGRHGCPEDGVSALELSSMLAGEPFGDRPHRVCPILAAFTRGYDVAVTHSQRQELIPLAADLVGTQVGRHEQDRRRATLSTWASLAWRHGANPEEIDLRRPRELDEQVGLEEAGVAVGTVAMHDPSWHVATLDLLVWMAAPRPRNWAEWSQPA